MENKLEEYIKNNPAREILVKYREFLKKLLPQATEVISYGIPTFDYKGKHVIHYAGYKGHIGIYPTSGPLETFKDRLKGYKTTKGTIQIPLDAEIPFKLLEDIVKHRLEQIN